ncbi:hypothetical protein CBL_00230 [Carabus blaptoides fortunei]
MQLIGSLAMICSNIFPLLGSLYTAATVAIAAVAASAVAFLVSLQLFIFASATLYDAWRLATVVGRFTVIGGWVWPRDHDVVDHDKINETIDTKNYVLIKSQAIARS